MAGSAVAWKPNWQIGERFLIPVPDRLAPLPVGFDAGQLMDADGGLQIHHVVFEAAFDHLVVLVTGVTEAVPGVLAHAVQRQRACAA